MLRQTTGNTELTLHSVQCQ